MKNKKNNLKVFIIGISLCVISALSFGIYAYVTDGAMDKGVIKNIDPTLDVVSKDISEVHPGISNTNDKIIKITKTINKNKTNLAHGNPTFLFKLKSEPLSEKAKDLYISFEFTKEYIDNNTLSNGNVSMTKTLTNLDSGHYKIFELNTNRHLSEIAIIINGSISTDKKYANISLINGSLELESASLEFVETLYNIEMFSHNDISIEEF